IQLIADHLLAAEGYAHGFGDEVLMATDGPRDGRAAARWFEIECGRVCALERLCEVDFDVYEVGRLALDNRHAPLTNLVVAGPGEGGAFACRRSLVSHLGLRIELGPR